MTRRVHRLWLSPAAAIVAVMGLIALAPPDSIAVGTLLSKGRPVTASSSYGGRPPRAANDGSLSTYWMAAGRTAPQRWTVDLGSSKSIGRVIVDWRKADCLRCSYQILGSNDRSDWTLLADRRADATTGRTSDQVSGAYRFVRLKVLTTPGRARIYEVRVYAAASVTPTPAPTLIVADHYVAKNGDDLSGDGSAGSPWRTVQKAADSVAAGEVVAVGAGVYDERVTIPVRAGGTAARPTQFIAGDAVVVRRGFVVNADYTSLTGFEVTPGAAFTGDPDADLHRGQVQVNGSHDTFAGFTIHDTPGSGFVVNDDRTHTTIRDFTIRRVGSSGIVTATSNAGGADHTTILNGTIAHHRGWSGIQLTGDYNVVDTVTIVGGPSGTSAGGIDGDGIRVNYSTGSVIRNTVIRDLWEWYNNSQHTDCIQMWASVRDLLIDRCTLGTWEPGPTSAERGGLAQEIGPSQIIMCGTVKPNSHVDFTLQNSLLLGQGGSSASIVTAKDSGATIAVRLLNNTFWSSSPLLDAADSALLRNNIFRCFYLDPAGKSGVDSDYNVFCWLPSERQNALPASEGPHSLGRTYGTRVDPLALFVNPDVSAATGYGRTADFRLRPMSPVEGRADRVSAPPYDITGSGRSDPPDIGAYD